MDYHYWLKIFTAGLCVLVFSLTTSDGEAKTGRTYKVHGIVIAVTLSQTPPLIVVKTPLGPRNHMTVGATVTAQTTILRGKKPVALSTILEGESVWLTYVKTTGGVVAKTIRVGP